MPARLCPASFGPMAGIVVEKATTGVACDQLCVGEEFVVFLWPHHHIAGHAFLFEGFGDGVLAFASDPLVEREGSSIDCLTQRLLLGAELGEALFISRRDLLGVRFFAFDFFHVGNEFLLSFFQSSMELITRFHADENLLLALGDEFLSEINLMHESAVLIVGLYRERLFAELGDLLLPILDLRFQSALIGLLGLEGG